MLHFHRGFVEAQAYVQKWTHKEELKSWKQVRTPTENEINISNFKENVENFYSKHFPVN